MAINKRIYTVNGMSLGERIQERMLAEGLSQSELARRVGVSQPAIYALIHNNKTGSRRLPEIARELNTTPAYLTGETDDPESDAPPDSLTSEERSLLAKIRTLPSFDRQAVLRIVEALTRAPGQTSRQRTGRAIVPEPAHGG